MAAVKWPVEFPGLEQLDRLLRCGICYEYFSTALMTGCSHNYCSLCIRKSIGYRTECPTCMKETFESHLRSNRILDDVVTLYLGFKSKLLSALLHKHSSLELDEVPVTSGHGADDKLANTKQQLKSIPSEREVTATSEEQPHCELFNREIVSNPNVKEISDNDLRNAVTPRKNMILSQLAVGGPSTSKSSIKIPAMFASPKKSVQNTELALKKVTCPVCDVDIPEKNINFHLDNCLQREDQVKSRDQLRETRKPLKKPVFSLLKQADLKKKLKEHGLNNTGSRETLIKRFERFILLYNTECDALKPRPVAEIIRQVEQEEQEEKKIPAPQKIFLFPKNDNEKSDDIRREYLKKNKSSFDNLIQKAKQQLQQKKQSQPAYSSITEKVIEDSDQGSVAKEVQSTQNNLPSDDSECSSNSNITNEVDIKNSSSKKRSRKLQFTDDEYDPEDDIKVTWTHRPTSLVGQITHTADDAVKNACVLSTDNAFASGTTVSSAVNTPPKYVRNSDATDSGNDSNTPNLQGSPVFAPRSSVKKFRSDCLEVQASPEMFIEEIRESYSLRNGDASDAESEKSISLLEFDEGGTSFGEQRGNSCQFIREAVSNNLSAQDFPSEAADLRGSPFQESSGEYIPSVHQRKSKRRNLHVMEQENFDRVLRKRSKR